MDTIPANDPMQNPPQIPLGGLDPANLLQQGVAEDTFMDGAASPFNPPPIKELSAIFPQFEILEIIGQGGMGAVYKVRQKDLDRIVALKILPPAIGQSPEFSKRFTREAKALAKLNHPGIVTLHEFGQQDGLYFILMEFVDGVNLAQLMKSGRISPREALAIIPQICDALQFAHDQGIVHRDIKPENLLLDRLGRVKIADFGIAKIVDPHSSFVVPPSGGSYAEDRLKAELPTFTEAGKIIGTPQYMAPEQISHPAEVDHRADIYALGVVFYQMLTGELPGKRFEAPSQKVHIDVRLDEIVLRAMEKNPDLRYQQVREVKTMVEMIAEGKPHSEKLKAETQAAVPETQSAVSNNEPRFSRTAIVGAFWAIFVPLHFILPLLIPIGWANYPLVQFAALLLALAFWTAPVGITLLGWIAVAQIRRSVGKLHGLWLAVFDGLLFPLLALDGVIVFAPIVVLKTFDRVLLHSMASPVMIPIWLLAPFVLGVIALIDYLIIRRVWRTVNKTGGAAPAIETTKKVSDADKNAQRDGHAFLVPLPRNRFWKWLIVTVLATMLIPIAIKVILPSKNTQSQHAVQPYLRITVRVLDVPATFDDAQLLRPSGLLDSGEVNILAAPYVVVPSGSEGEIQIPEVAGMEKGFSHVLSGRTKTLYVKPTLKPGSYWLDYQLEGLEREAGADATNYKRQPIRSGSLRLGELQLMESYGSSNGRRQLAIICAEMEVKKADAAGNILATPSAAPNPSFGPVIERTLPLDDKGLTDLLDLDTNQVIPSPNPPDMAKGLELLSKPGLVISRDEQKGETELMGMNGVMTQESRADQWEEITNIQALDTIRRNVSSRGVTIGAVVTQSGLPQTFLFKTVAGKIGILQITGFTENPRGVKIRYKLVQSAGSITVSAGSFIRQSGTYQLSDGGGLALTPSNGGLVSFALKRASGVGRETVSIPDFFKQDGWFVYIDSAERVWTFDGIRQLDVVAPDGRYSAGYSGVRALCPAAVWNAVPESVRKFYRETINDGGSRDMGEPQKASFGPVVERVLTGDPSLPPTFLNLQDGDLVFSPEESRGMSSKMFTGWWQSSRADFLVAVMEKKHLLVTLENGGTKFALIPAAKWDSTTIAELVDSLQKGTSLQAIGQGGIVSYVLPEPVLLPATFAVESRNGVKGLLQIIGFTENPSGVKLRYKLVRQDVGRVSVSPEILAELARMRAEAVEDFESRLHPNPEEDPEFTRRIQERADRAEELLRGTVAELVLKEQHRLIREIDEAKKSGDEALRKRLEAEINRVNEQLEKLLPLEGLSPQVTPKPIPPGAP